MKNKGHPKSRPLSRRAWLHMAGVSSLSGPAVLDGQDVEVPPHQGLKVAPDRLGGAMGLVGQVSTEFFDPTGFLRSWNFSDLPPTERARFYRETPRENGTLLREYEFFAVDRDIEIAPGVFFPAWTYNGQVPGPTIRATVGDQIRIRFVNQGSHPHTIHFHGWHAPGMDGSLSAHQVMPGDSFLYEFEAEPFGLHLYHCHASPLKRHIHKGLYGVFIVDPPNESPRVPADELVLVLNGFDTNFDAENEVYAANTVASFYMQKPIRVRVGQLVRMYVVNMTEFDLINSLHLHGMFFDVLRTGTRLSSSESTDTIMLCQGERAILETTFRYQGDFMFHAHQSEFAELGWMGMFRAEEQHGA